LLCRHATVRTPVFRAAVALLEKVFNVVFIRDHLDKHLVMNVDWLALLRRGLAGFLVVLFLLIEVHVKVPERVERAFKVNLESSLVLEAKLYKVLGVKPID
jgi:hypothetical protein